jgi:chromosomal replication initiator protein
VTSGVAAIPLPGVAFAPLDDLVQGPAALAPRAFHAGPENLLVGVAVKSLLEDGQPRFTPLLLLGTAGVGKTHLAQGIARRWSETGRAGEVIYLTGGDFARQLAEAIDRDAVRPLRGRLRGAALLVLDDLTQLVKKPAALKELLFTLDALERSGGAAVVTSRIAPSEMPQLPPALASRLTGGLTVGLSPPGPDARRAILRELAAARGIALAPEAAETLAREPATGAPELLQRLLQAGGGFQSVDADRARQFLADRVPSRQPTLAAITRAAAKQFSLKSAQLKSASRNRTVVAARSVAMYLARKLTGHSLEQIGRAFGGRDHTTVLHGCRKIEKQLETDPAVRQTVRQLQEVLMG